MTSRHHIAQWPLNNDPLYLTQALLSSLSIFLSINSFQDHIHNLKYLPRYEDSLEFLSPEFTSILNTRPRYSAVYFMCLLGRLKCLSGSTCEKLSHHLP